MTGGGLQHAGDPSVQALRRLQQPAECSQGHGFCCEKAKGQGEVVFKVEADNRREGLNSSHESSGRQARFLQGRS